MDKEKLLKLKQFYKSYLLDSVIPFWMKYFLDKKNGGYYNYLDKDGSIYNSDKAVWIQGRGTWIFSKLYNDLEQRGEWLAASKLGYDFLRDFCYDKNGKMYFQVTCDGKPLRMRRYWYSETFSIMGCAEYYKATGDKEALKLAKDTYNRIVHYYKNPGSFPPKYIPETRAMRTHAESMILISTTQILSEIEDDPFYSQVLNMCINDIFKHFVKKEESALLENVGLNGEIINTPQGRCINPGHAIESAWFIIHEGMRRNDQLLINNGLEIMDWSLERGWDNEYGGLFNFTDLEGKCPEQLEWDMKFWWPHNEAMYGMLLAYYLTGNPKYEKWYEKIHEWSFNNFSDPVYGDWYGYLHRDGTVALTYKGSSWKGPFHLPRQLLFGLKIIDNIIENI